MAALFAAYPDYRREIIELIEEGDRLAARWRKIKAYWKLYPFSY